MALQASAYHLLSAGFALLYPPYIWIPAFAGMTKEVQFASGGVPTVRQCPRITGKLRVARATHRGAQRGEAPLRYWSFPLC